MALIKTLDLLKDPDYIASERLARKISDKISGKTFHTHFHLLYLLRKFLGEKQKTYLEIGTYFGASICLMLQSPYACNIFGIDSSLFTDNRSRSLKKNINFFLQKSYLHTVTLLPGESQNIIVRKMASKLLPVIDLLYIDGDRSSNGVIQDLMFYSQFVPLNGFIVIDDYHDLVSCPGVQEGIFQILPWIQNRFHMLTHIPNRAKASLTKTFKFKEAKYPKPVYNQLLILQKIRE